MISRLQGILIAKQAPSILLDVSGVGYEVEVPMSTFTALPETGQKLVLHTHLLVREDMHALYGFLDNKERTLFRQLLKVNGVGAKVALAILSVLTPNDLMRAVLDKSTTQLVRVPGIGKKTAERLLIDLYDRIKDLQLIEDFTAARVQPEKSSIEQEALGALMALGYKEQEAARVLRQLDTETITSSNDLIRLALQQIAQ